MRILWLNPGLLLPLDKGGKLRTWHLLRHLARHHEITYLSFADPSTSPAEREGMREVCTHLQLIPREDPPKGSLAFYAGAAWRLIDPLPYAVGKYRSPRYRDTIRQVLSHTGFDLVVCDFLVPAVNMPYDLPCPAVLFTHNVESEIWRRHAEQQPDPLRRLLFHQQRRRMLRFERETVGRFDLVLAVSATDRDTLTTLYGPVLRAPVATVSTGVDTTFFAPRASTTDTSESSTHLVYTGSMDWIPNEDAMVHFCRDILPRIRSQEPGVTLSIVGRSPTPKVQRLAEIAGVEVTGRVADVRDHISRAAIYVVPIRIGGGTRLKIFEAMAMGTAVVSTTVGAEGLPLVDGEHAWIADTSEAFAAAVVRLIRQPARRQRLESAARELVVGHYDWGAVSCELEAALTRAARFPATAAA